MENGFTCHFQGHNTKTSGGSSGTAKGFDFLGFLPKLRKIQQEKFGKTLERFSGEVSTQWSGSLGSLEQKRLCTFWTFWNFEKFKFKMTRGK